MNTHLPKLLFICKKRTTEYGELKSSGLLNSARMIVQSLIENKIANAKLVDVIDGNCIDREVHQYKPTHVILEAYWCPPFKLIELSKLYPKIHWTVRNHSKLPFLSGEGIAMEWSRDYMQAGSTYSLSSNSFEAVTDFEDLNIPCDYLPNIYSDEVIELENNEHHFHKILNHTINVGCFGAIRLLKNHLMQSIAAIRYADDNNYTLNFHINVERIEMQKANQVLKNLRGLFKGTKHNLVEHQWLEREEFLSLIKKMDIGLQVTLTETFNIVAADFLLCGIPIVVSDEIDWMPSYVKANPHSVDNMVKRMDQIMKANRAKVVNDCIKHLNRYNDGAISEWEQYLI
jgi:hypothetical protein